MTILDILGTGGRLFLRKLLANDVDRLAGPGHALYSCMCNEHGAVIDDLIVYQRASDNYRVVLNAATRERDLEWIRAKSEGFSVGLQERQELAMIAVQGPEAIARTLQVLKGEQLDAVATLGFFESVDVDDYFFARTGYTGEDGLEIILPAAAAADFWSSLVEVGVKPCGLAARDTLRLEAGCLLYGQDMDETTTPLESGLAWTVKFEPATRDFIGMGALLSQKQQGLKRQLVGLILQDKGVMRAGQRVILPDNSLEGVITSGTYSPMREQSIAFARIPLYAGKEVLIEIRGRQVPAQLHGLQFVKRGKIL